MHRNRKRHGHDHHCQAAQAGPDAVCEHGCCALSSLGSGHRCRIRRHHAQGAVRQRLLAMGFVPNTEVEVVRVATLGDPMEIRVGDSFITLRKREAAQIEVRTA